MAKKLQLRRGTTSQHSSFTGAVGEVTVDTDKKVVVVHDGSTAGGVPLAKASDVTILDEDNFATDSATKAPSQQSTKAYIAATSQPLDADLTSLASCQSGAAGAIAALTQTEVEILDGATVTTAELNTLDGYTGDKDDLIYAKDLKATGVTAVEFDYLDGVTSAIQTQLDAKGDAKLDTTQTFSGTKSFDAVKVAKGTIHTITTTTGNIAIDFSDGNNQSVTLTGNPAFVEPSNQVAGQSGSIFITQDGTGSRVVSAWHADWKFAGNVDPVLSTAGNSVDRLDYIILADNSVHGVLTKAIA